MCCLAFVIKTKIINAVCIYLCDSYTTCHFILHEKLHVLIQQPSEDKKTHMFQNLQWQI